MKKKPSASGKKRKIETVSPDVEIIVDSNGHIKNVEEASIQPVTSEGKTPKKAKLLSSPGPVVEKAAEVEVKRSAVDTPSKVEDRSVKFAMVNEATENGNKKTALPAHPSILSQHRVFPDLPVVDDSLDDDKRFEAELNRFLALRKQIRTMETFIHRTELDFVISQLAGDSRPNSSSNEPPLSQDTLEKLMISSCLPLMIKFIQTKIVRSDKLSDLAFLSVQFDDFAESPIASSLSSQTVLPHELQNQKQFLCTRFAQGTGPIRQHYRQQFQQIFQILLNYKSLLETILEIKWKCLQFMRR